MTTSRLHRPTLLLLLAMAGGSLLAQAPSGYYDPAAGKTGTELRQALHDIIDNHTTISYGQIWNAFWSTDNKGNGVVWDMYSDNPGGTPPYTYYLGQNICGSGGYNGEGDCYNREHSWPQSWFNEQTTPRTDLHHVFPTDGYVNNQRSSYPFGEVQNASWTSLNGSKLGSCKSSLGYSGTVFEPIDEYKGDFARAYFYMSTRYYGEDSDWGSSGMTNKAEIKPWAMAMLLDWSDNDPVSQKEIDRNNAIYTNYQHNRNPFVDHPEYARMIWDENYQGGAYSIVCASGIQHGTISAPTSAVEGSTVNLYATPDAGYMLGSWNVYKTTEPNTTVAVTNNSFVMPSYAVTVSATFVVNNTNYNITCVQNLSHGSISASPTSARSGATVTLSNSPASGYSLYSYYVYKTGDINTIVYSGSGNTFTMPAYDVTVSASFAQGTGGNGDYVKVTSAPSDWSGEYLIVYENGSKAFNGGLTTLDATSNCISVTITNSTIASNATTNASRFTIAPMTGGYSIQAASGKYIGNSSNSNSLTASDTPLANTLTFNNSNVDIVSSGGAYLRFNNASDQNRFRYYKSSTYTEQKAIQLYKKTGGSVTAPTHTIQFNPNGGSGSGYTQTVNEFEPTALDANTFTRSGYAFYGWNTAANGSGTFYADGATVTLLNDLTLYAQWTPTYTITCQSVEHGTIETSVNEAAEGDLVSLTATPDAGYDLDYWMVTDANNEPVDVANNAFVMPGCDVTVSAEFAAYVDAYAQEYFLVTSVDQLIADRTYLIVNVDAGKALSTTQNTNNRAATAVSIDQLDGWKRIASIANTTACEFTLGSSTNGTWTFFDSSYSNNTGGYLYAASGSANQLKTETTLDDNGKWSISIESDGRATLTAQGTNTRNTLRYNPNNGNPIFSCYASNNSDMQDVYLFIKGEEFEHTQSETIAQLLPSDKHTVHSGATLTVSATATSGSPSHIILEEGAQLVHNSDGVKATLKKTVNGYTGDGGWYTIATPFVSLNPSEVGGMTDGSYDLYSYDEDGDANGKEWVNYKPNGSFGMASGLGYLYANGNSRTLRMGGTLNSGNYSQQVELSYNNGSDNIKGFNLLGNPTAHDISFVKSNNVSDGYYYLNHDGMWVYQTGSSVPVGRGFLVKANATGQTVTLNPQSRGERPEEGQYLCLSVGDEKAYVKLDEGVSMPLLDFKGQHSNLYFVSEHKPYVMLVREDDDALDLCYETQSNGTKTLTVDTKGLELSYLHLIDNLTGADVDLFATSSYQFEAKKGDYATRFRLVFGPSTSPGTEGSTSFAYFANGEIRFVEACQDALLQIVDMTGRVFYSGDAMNRVFTKGMAPGVYVLRLVTDDNIRFQKIAVK